MAGTARVAGEPDAVWFNPEHGRRYAAAGSPGVVGVIDTVDMTVAGRAVTEPAHTAAVDAARRRCHRAAVYDEVAE